MTVSSEPRPNPSDPDLSTVAAETPGASAGPPSDPPPAPDETEASDREAGLVGEDDAIAKPAAEGEVAPSASVPMSATVVAYRRPTFVFFGLVAGLSLLADVASKAWAQVVLSQRTLAEPGVVLIKDHLTLTLAYNRGGAWGVFQDASDAVRRPFFLLVSVAAIVFIVSLYNRLHPSQRALTWGLPLVLGGALGNLTDRIVRHSVIDFIDFRAAWVGQMNQLIQFISPGWTITEHWPTFNIADVSICAGVVLMGIDMLFSRRGPVAGASDGGRHAKSSAGATSGPEAGRPPREGAPVSAVVPPSLAP